MVVERKGKQKNRDLVTKTKLFYFLIIIIIFFFFLICVGGTKKIGNVDGVIVMMHVLSDTMWGKKKKSQH